MLVLASTGQGFFLSNVPARRHSDCAAVSACIDHGYTSANNEYTFDIHYLIAEDVWSGNCFYQGDNTNYFTITHADVGVAYGYVAVS
jgi:hypothetical protein